MKNILSCLLLIIIIVIFYNLFQKFYRTEVTYVISPYDNKSYLVRNIHDKTKAAYLLSKIVERLSLLIEYLKRNIGIYNDEQKMYINRLIKGMNHVIFSESAPDSKYTSYTVNKGEEIVMCLRCKKTNQFHNLNVLMYVAIHEISHVACPTLDHDPPFGDIFKFFLGVALKEGLWSYENYANNPAEYCGTVIRENILEKN